jgi:hypothetical protein
MSDEEVAQKASEFSDPDWSRIETIRDQERWIIQKSRLASRPLGRIGRKARDKVSKKDVF